MRPQLIQCSSCHAQIYMVKTEKGNNMPIDAKPVADGNIIFVEPPGWTPGDDKVAHVLHKDEVAPDGVLRWVSHFATCTSPKAHRRRKAKQSN